MKTTDIVEPERVYLQPQCCVPPYEGRQWCEDNVWPTDGDCDATGVEYVRADLVEHLRQEIARRDALLREARIYVDECFGDLDRSLSARIDTALNTTERSEG